MNTNDEKWLKARLQEHLPPVTGELDHDLWPRMQARLEVRTRPIPWWDWALAAAAVVLLVLAPQSILLLFYHF